MIVLDGAMGTELARRGVETTGPDGSARALEQAPDVVRRVHREYGEAGAMILTANSFGLRPDDPKLEARAASAVQLARRARSAEEIRVAGSVGPLGVRGYGEADLAAGYRRLAGALIDGGCDLLLLETQLDLAEAATAAHAVTEASRERDRSVPCWLALACRPDGCTLLGHDPRSMEPGLADAWLVGCTAVEALPAALARLPGSPRGIVPSTGAHRGDRFEPDAVAEGEVARAAIAATSEGPEIVGGCCGTTPAYVRRVAEALLPDAEARARAWRDLDALVPRAGRAG